MDSAADARRHAQAGLDRHLHRLRAIGRPTPEGTLDEVMTQLDVYCGTPEQVIALLRQDTVLARVTDISMQVHPVDPPHELILRAIELFATVVAPALGWCAQAAPPARRTGT